MSNLLRRPNKRVPVSENALLCASASYGLVVGHEGVVRLSAAPVDMYGSTHNFCLGIKSHNVGVSCNMVHS